MKTVLAEQSEPGTGLPISRQLCQRLPDTQGRKRTSWLPRAAQAILGGFLNGLVPRGHAPAPRGPFLKPKPMFTGLVESLGHVVAVVAEPPGVRLVVEAAEMARDAQLGESICISGCCLSVVRVDAPRLEFQLGPETLARTSLRHLAAGKHVNLERSLRLSDRLGGHLVTGHVDGQGRLEARVQEGDWVTCRFTAAPALLGQMASKGSVAIDGVSLTLVDVTGDWFSVALIPHTLACTTLGGLTEGDLVNLETDLVFKYVARWLEGTR